jgi:hypothetical protein
MIVACSATASRRTSSGGAAPFAASMAASETSVTGNSRRLSRVFGHCPRDQHGERLGEVPVEAAAHQFLLPWHPEAGGACLRDSGRLVGGEGQSPGGFLRRQVRLRG